MFSINNSLFHYNKILNNTYIISIAIIINGTAGKPPTAPIRASPIIRLVGFALQRGQALAVYAICAPQVLHVIVLLKKLLDACGTGFISQPHFLQYFELLEILAPQYRQYCCSIRLSSFPQIKFLLLK